jgi:DNA repair photolyase
MIIKEIEAKAILSTSKVHDYVINPYIGCQHACTYCYARFMKRFTGHKEPWGKFVDVKINAPHLLETEIKRKKRGSVWVSGVCDPYQPLEAKYRLSRRCLEILQEHGWPVIVQTRSPLILRDIDILKQARDFEVGFTVTTTDDRIQKWFEPSAPSIKDRLNALDALHNAGIRTYAMIAPMLPSSEGLPEALKGKVDYIIADRMNYKHADWVYRKYGLDGKLTDDFFYRASQELGSACRELGIQCRVVC